MEFSKEKIEETKDYWQPYYEDQILTDEDAIEILTNVYNLFKLLDECNERRKAREQKK